MDKKDFFEDVNKENKKIAVACLTNRRDTAIIALSFNGGRAE